MLGHAKTILVLLASWIVFDEPMTSRKLLGIGMAVAGMVAYSSLGTKQQKPAATPAARSSSPGSSFVTAEVALKPGRVSFKQAAAAAGLLASYPINVTDDDAATQVTVQKGGNSDGGVDSEFRGDSDSIAASVVRRHRTARV